MARRMSWRGRLVAVAVVVSILDLSGLPGGSQQALAARLDRKDESEAKEATRLFKQGSYEDAAQIFARLAVDHPDMEIFERNLGACFYHLRKPEPAISNLRHYLSRKKNLAADDEVAVNRWIDEMEKLRAQLDAAQATGAAESSAPSAVVASRGSAETSSTNAPQPVPLGSAPSTLAPPAPEAAPAVDLSARPEAGHDDRPFYKAWWFWTAAGAVVVGGTLTAILLAGRSSDPCAGANLPCVGAK